MCFSSPKLPAPPPPIIAPPPPTPPPPAEATALTVGQARPEGEATPKKRRNPLRVDKEAAGSAPVASSYGLNIPM